MKTLFTLLTLLVFIGCNSFSEDKSTLPILEDSTPEKEEVTEIFTRTYTVKKENGLIVKDTVRKIESIILNKSGRELGKNLYTLSGEIFNSEVYKYNSNGYRIGADLFKDGDLNTGYFVFDLDDQGRQVKQVLFNKANDEKIMEAHLKYLNEGKVKQQGGVDQGGHFIPTHEFIYDEDGKELGYNVFQPYTTNKVFYTFKYTKWNDENQWVERQALKNDIVEAIFVRNFSTKEI